MTDSPPFDPPYLFAEKTAQGARIIETRTDGSQHERMVPEAEAIRLLDLNARNAATVAATPTRSTPQKNSRSASGMPLGSTLLKVPFAEKDEAKKLGARWNADRKCWYVPPGIDLGAFSRWQSGED
jgi:hypothetical protein